MNYWLILLGVMISTPFIIEPVFAQTTTARQAFCYEDFDDMCGLLSTNPADVFGAILQPLEVQVPGFSLVILWGGILAILWFKTENIMLLGIAGILVSSTITGLSSNAQGIGMLLLAVSIGLLLFQMIRQRVTTFA